MIGPGRFPSAALQLFIVVCLLISVNSYSQQSTITVPASIKYARSESYQKLWGHHYRKEWGTPVTFKIAMLDTLAGGLVPYEAGGGRQSMSLRLKDANGREYVLRSIDKSFGKALPEIYQGTFIETKVNDQVTIAHPYSALTIPLMATAAGIYHTNPVIYYVPEQKALGKFNEYGNALYLFEQRPDENWETAPNFGNSKNVVGTDKMLENIHGDNDHIVDQLAFARTRLFDMFIGDWGRHEDQWRWATFKNDGQTIYKPIPRDRDQAYTLFDGKLVGFFKSVGGVDHLQSFEGDIKDMYTYNFPARNLDRHLLNSVSLSSWVRIANELQTALTDGVIESAIRKIPPEVYDISGPTLIAKLKSRRGHLQKFAKEYYHILAREVDITGSEKNELFEINRNNNDSTTVNIYEINKEGKIKEQPIYHRVFYRAETKEIRLYGLKGQDDFKVTGNVDEGILVRLIGGPEKDRFTEASVVRKGGRKTLIYDNSDNEFSTSRASGLKLSPASSVHAFNYGAYYFDKKGFRPLLLYNRDDRIYVGLAYKTTTQQWRKVPFGVEQYIDVKYSISQNAFSSTYKGTFNKLMGRWDGILYGNYDFIRWTNFYGLGNATTNEIENLDYNRMRTRNYKGSAGLQRLFARSHKLSLSGFYEGIKILKDSGRYIAKSLYANTPVTFQDKNFMGAEFAYIFQKLNDSILPTKGISFLTGIKYTHNFSDSKKNYGNFLSELNIYLPFTKHLGFAHKSGGATLIGTPEFYQYNNIGGTRTVRGYRRERFYGNTSFYSQNEFRWIEDVRSNLFNGKFGIFALYDFGRVWLDGEKSDKWHSGYGGGLLLSPFKKITISLAYGVSPEDGTVHLNLLKVL